MVSVKLVVWEVVPGADRFFLPSALRSGEREVDSLALLGNIELVFFFAFVLRFPLLVSLSGRSSRLTYRRTLADCHRRDVLLVLDG